jgi:3',5'-cyclic AMP phosphodiesterase CpdA
MRTIAHISDVHFGTVIPQVSDALSSEINSRRPSLIVVSGDLTQRARAWQYRAAAEFLGKLNAPKLVVPGNHDIPLWDVIRRFFAPLTYYKQFISSDLCPVFRDEEIFVMGINSARSFSFTWNGFWKDGQIDEEQLLDIKQRASDVPENVLKVLVTHHPFIPPPGERVHGIVHGATRALATFEACGIDLLLAGHLHMGYSGDVRTHHEATRRSILSIQAGTATSDRHRGREPNAYNWIEAELNRVNIEVRTRRGKCFDRSVLKRFTREQQIWTEQAR